MRVTRGATRTAVSGYDGSEEAAVRGGICPDIVQASGGCAAAILTEIRVGMRQAQVAVGEKVD